jgi:predicted small lipoprotein YifL
MVDATGVSLANDTQSAMVREISEPPVPRPPRAFFYVATFRFAAIGALALALPLTGCGRKGPLDPPPGGYQLEDIPGRSAPVTRKGAKPAEEKQPDYDDEGRPIAPKGLKKKLPADWLID